MGCVTRKRADEMEFPILLLGSMTVRQVCLVSSVKMSKKASLSAATYCTKPHFPLGFPIDALVPRCIIAMLLGVCRVLPCRCKTQILDSIVKRIAVNVIHLRRPLSVMHRPNNLVSPHLVWCYYNLPSVFVFNFVFSTSLGASVGSIPGFPYRVCLKVASWTFEPKQPAVVIPHAFAKKFARWTFCFCCSFSQDSLTPALKCPEYPRSLDQR